MNALSSSAQRAKRAVRSLGGRLIRRWRLLPGGVPDGLGQDESLLGSTWSEEVMVYFPDTPEGLYQIRQWYRPLGELARARGVVVVCADSRTAHTVRAESNLRVVTVSQDSTLDDVLSRSATKLCLYVNHSIMNFVCLQFRSLIHVSMLHGDSDKETSVSNQVKAYDYSFVGGQAQIDRLARHTMLFDAQGRCIPIGRPGLSAWWERDTAPSGDARRTVLYAPTWEGANDLAAYGSGISHGPRLIEALIGAGLRVIYRPHPLAGVRVAQYGEADSMIKVAIHRHAGADPGAGHEVSGEGELESDMARADLLITDVSAVCIEWLPSLRPLIVTTPAGQRVQPAQTKLLDAVPRLSAAGVDQAGTLAVEQLDDDPGRGVRKDLVSYYVGHADPEQAMGAFLDACSSLIRHRDEQMQLLGAEAEGTSS